jgi:hypothetical protein
MVARLKKNGVLTFNVVKIIVHLTRFGSDEVYIYTDYPPPVNFKSPPNDNLFLQFKVAKNKGVSYVKDNFNMIPEILNTRL